MWYAVRTKIKIFYSHVNYSVTKICNSGAEDTDGFYSHVNYSVTKIPSRFSSSPFSFYSHVNYSVTKIFALGYAVYLGFTVT